MARRTRQSTIRLTEWEYEQLESIAKSEGRKINQVLVDSLYEYAFQQYQESKNFLDSVDNGMLKPSSGDSQEQLKKLYHAFSTKAKAAKPLHDQRLLDEEYSEPTDEVKEDE